MIGRSVMSELDAFSQPLVSMKGAIDSVKSERGMGGMLVTFRVPMGWKMEAMGLTDHHGVMMRLDVCRVPRTGAADPDA